ncbi:MAG: TGS domain-containing protein, partial [Candidatus Nanoarchaeia archaeon]
MDITITFPDGKKGKFKKGITALEIASSISEGLARAVCAAKVDGELVDATKPIEKSAKLELLKFDGEGKEVFWHSTAHLLAQAVLRVFPEAKPTIGPVIDEGFYYDFDHPPFSPEDLKKIEGEMKNIVKERLETKRKVMKSSEALKVFKDNKYKCEIIKEAPKDDVITAYEQGDFIDLCRGPHLPHTGMIKAFKLTKMSAAYWRGDAKKASLQRIYGVSYPDKKLLKDYLTRMEEAAKRDHKKIGREQELFMIHEMVGKGLPVWLPKGEVIKNEIEKYAVEMEQKAGYVQVSTPHLAKEELFLTSGHLPHYEDSMYPKMEMDDGTYFLKAMNCPLHHLVYNHSPRSHRELPLRIAEYGTVYRNELSGTLSGLLR